MVRYSSANSSFITGPGTLTVTSGPPSDGDTWKSANNVSGGPEIDNDHDGLTNFAEYAFGLDPKSSTSSSPYLSSLDSARNTLTYIRRKKSLTGVTYHIRTSTNLTHWTEDTGAVQNATAIPGTDNESVEVTLSPGYLNAGRLFVRIHAN